MSVFVLALRLWWSRQPLFGAGDLHRSIYTGRAVLAHGLRAAGRPLSDYYPNLGSAVPWKQNPFNYPPVPVGFFTLVAAMGGGVVLAKVLLTVCDVVSAVLIGRVTKRPMLGVLFFASPVSMWWSSHEGQFDALQTCLGVGALSTLQMPFVSGMLLALAIQTKVTAAALLPFVLWQMHRQRTLRKWCHGFAVALLPVVLCSFVYPVVPNILRYSTQFRANPYALVPVVFAGMWPASTAAGLIVPQILSWLLLGWLLGIARRSLAWARVLPALVFLAFVKLNRQVPGWYVTALPLMLLPIFLRDAPGSRSQDGSERSLRFGWAAALTLEINTLATIAYFYLEKRPH